MNGYVTLILVLSRNLSNRVLSSAISDFCRRMVSFFDFNISCIDIGRDSLMAIQLLWSVDYVNSFGGTPKARYGGGLFVFLVPCLNISCAPLRSTTCVVFSTPTKRLVQFFI